MQHFSLDEEKWNEVEELIIAERARETKEIETQVVHLAETQKHISELVHDDGEKLSIMEENILSVVSKSYDATESLAKAENYQNSRYFKGGIIAAVIVGIGATALALKSAFGPKAQ